MNKNNQLDDFYEEVPAEVEADEVDDTDLDDDETTFDSEVDPDESESDDEAEEPEEADTEAETEEEVETTDTDEASAEPAEDTTTTEPSEDDIKAYNKQMAENRIAAKQEREAALRAQQEQYVAEADSDDPRDLALRQLEVDAYTNKVNFTENKLITSYEKALKDFDILRNPDPVVQAEVADALSAFEARYVTIDQLGNPTEVRGDLYSDLQRKAESISKLTGIGAKQQIQSKDKEKSKVLSTPVRAPKAPKVDADLAGFDEEASRW